jgi:hypothetical protein
MKPYAITRKTRKTRKNPYPYTRVTRTLRTGTGFCGYGYGLPWDTPGLPVIIPSYRCHGAVRSYRRGWRCRVLLVVVVAVHVVNSVKESLVV